MANDYKETKIGFIPNDWSVENLNNILNYESSNLSLNKLEENEGKYKLYGASGFIKGIDFYQGEEPYFAIVKDGSGYGNLLWCEGKTSILGTLGRLKSKPNTSLLFYYYLMHRINYKTYMSGSTIPHLYFKDYGKMIVVKPPLSEQYRIAEILSTVDEAIEKTDAIIEETRQLKKGLMQKLFTEGIGHTRFKNWDRSNLKGSRIQISSVGSLPESWSVSSIGEIALDKKGSVKIGPFGSQLKKDEMVEEGIRVFGQENVFKKDFRIGTYFITKEKFETLKTVEIFPNDIVLTMMGTIGDCCVAPSDIDRGIMDSHLIRIQVKIFINQEYVARLIRESQIVKKQVECFAQGAIMSGLNLSLVKEILLPIPPIEEQNEIENILSKVDAKIEKEEATKAELEQLKKGLMQVLLTGKVRVKA